MTRETELLCHRLDELRGQIDADTAALRTRWHRSPFSSRWLVGVLAAVGGLLVSARSAALVKRSGVKPLIAVAVVRFLLRTLSKPRH